MEYPFSLKIGLHISLVPVELCALMNAKTLTGFPPIFGSADANYFALEAFGAFLHRPGRA
jgi:hypothetical protein